MVKIYYEGTLADTIRSVTGLEGNSVYRERTGNTLPRDQLTIIKHTISITGVKFRVTEYSIQRETMFVVYDHRDRLIAIRPIRAYDFREPRVPNFIKRNTLRVFINAFVGDFIDLELIDILTKELESLS